MNMNRQKNKQEQYKALEYPIWKRMGKVSLGKPGMTYKSADVTVEGKKIWRENQALINQIKCSDLDIDDVYYSPNIDALDVFDSYKYGVGEKYVLEAETAFTSGYVVRIPSGREFTLPLIIDFTLSDLGAFVENLFIYAEKQSKASIVIRFFDKTNQTDQNEVYHNCLTKIYAEEDAQINITYIQMLGDHVTHINNTVTHMQSNSQIRFSSFDFGGALTATDYSAFLVGEGSKSDTLTAYLGDGSRKLDIGFNATHIGAHTNSSIECRGALLDRSKKVFRGNLKFEKGSRQSVGQEAEYVLLLDKQVHSDAIPALLCHEDDVVGEHAASAGQINENQLFYLMSRGFDEKEAKKLIVHGTFTEVIDWLPDDKLKEQVERELERRLLYENGAL